MQSLVYRIGGVVSGGGGIQSQDMAGFRKSIPIKLH